MALNQDTSQSRSLLGNRSGFQPLGGASGSDASVNIPLGKVPTGNAQFNNPATNEKAGFFKKGPKVRGPPKQRKAKPKNPELTAMGKIYDTIFNFSIITRYLLFSFPLGILIAVPIVLGATVFTGENLDGLPIVWVFTWVEAVWIALWVSKIFARLLPSIFEFLAGAVSPGVKKYSLAIQRLEIPISLVGWAVASLATFIPILTHHPSPNNQCQLATGKFVDCGTSGTDANTLPAWTGPVQQVMTAALIATFIFLGEKMFVQFVSINYHAMQYERRIKDSKHQVFLLGVLYDASRALFEPFCPEFQEEDYIIHESVGIQSHSKGTSQNPSGTATPMRLIQNVGRFGDHITAAFGRVAHEVTGKDVFNPTASHSIVVEALERKESCEALARRIWMSLVVEGKEALFLEDIQEVLADRPVEDAVEAFQAVDRDGNGDVSLDEMILTICEIGRERRAVANSLHNIDSAINVLDNLLLLIAFFGVVFVFIAFLNSSFNTTLATAGATLLSVSFVFSSTAAEILNSCIFLFVKHPYDVDDRVDINEQQLVVERISLLYTVFRNVSTHKTTQAANSVLNAVWIENITRSKAMREQLTMYISFDTTLEDVELLRREMQNFVLEKENSRDFEKEVNVEVTGISEMNKMQLKIEIKHKSNWANETVRAARRSKFMCALVLALRRIPINAPGGGGAALGSADQPSYSVSVSDSEAAAARKAFADGQASGHIKNTAPTTGNVTTTGADLFPSRSTSLKQRNPSAGITNEASALAILNTRNPAADPSRDYVDGNVTSPTQRGGMETVAEEPEAEMMRRASTRGKRQSPHYSQGEYSQFLTPAASQMPPAPSRAAQPPLGRQQAPPDYSNFPPPPSSAGNGASPPRAPRYEMPPGFQRTDEPAPLAQVRRAPVPQQRSRSNTAGTSNSYAEDSRY